MMVKFTPIEILALIVAGLGGIKILLLLIYPKSLLAVAKKIYGKPVATTIVALVAAGVILTYLLAELTIVQIFAVMAFMMSIMAIGAAANGKIILEVAEKVMQDRSFLNRAWLCVIIWIALITWVFVEILA